MYLVLLGGFILKKITVVSLCSFVFLFICSLFAELTEGIFTEFLPPLVVGLVILFFSGIIAFMIREKTEINLICFVMSAIAMGFLMRAWYILRNLNNSLITMFVISLLCVVYLWIYFSVIRIPLIRRSTKMCIASTVIYFATTIAIYIYFAITTKTNFLSTIGYYMLIEAAFIFAMMLEVNSREELIRNLTLSTYSVFVVAIIIAVIAATAVLGDGDCDIDCCGDCCCDTVDFAGDIATGGKNKKHKK